MALDPTEIYYGIDGQRRGPVDLHELRVLLRERRLSPADYLWDPDLDDWVQVRRYPVLLETPPVQPPLGDPEPVESYEAVPESEAPVVDVGPALHPADPLLRAVAWTLDFLLLFLPNLMWQLYVQSRMGAAVESLADLERQLTPEEATVALQYLGMLGLGTFLLGLVYYTWFESSRWQGTPGKRMMGLIVADEGGRRIGPGRAAMRYLGRIPCRLTLGFGYLMILMTERRQGMHDKLAGTLVLKR